MLAFGASVLLSHQTVSTENFARILRLLTHSMEMAVWPDYAKKIPRPS